MSFGTPSQPRRLSPPLGVVAAAGLASGLLILGIGGRVLMRLLAFITPEAPRFTLAGTLEIVALGAGWGLLTAPLWRLVGARVRRRWVGGVVFGLLAFILAAAPFLLYSGFASGRLVAPRLFLGLGAVSFPALFVLHGLTVAWASARRGPSEPEHRPSSE